MTIRPLVNKMTLFSFLGFLAFYPPRVSAANANIAEVLDQAGLKYSLDKEGSAAIVLTINSKDIQVDVIPWNSIEGGLSLAHLYKNNGVNYLYCNIDPSCRGPLFKAAVYSFALSLNEFYSSHAKYTAELSSGVATTAATAPKAEVVDLNTIPIQYRDSDSKVKAWFKQQDLYGKMVTTSARIGMVRDKDIYFTIYTPAKNDSLLGSSLVFRVVPNNYSPLDYSENDNYIISGQLLEDEAVTFKIVNPDLILNK